MTPAGGRAKASTAAERAAAIKAFNKPPARVTGPIERALLKAKWISDNPVQDADSEVDVRQSLLLAWARGQSLMRVSHTLQPSTTNGSRRTSPTSR